VKTQLRPYLTEGEERALLAASVKASSRDHGLFSLALQTGLAARVLHRLDVAHVSPDGRALREQLALPSGGAANDNITMPLPDGLRSILMSYLGGIRPECLHLRAPVRTMVDWRGTELCAVCGHRIDFLRSPLFMSRFEDRLSLRRMRSLFASYRQRLGLPSYFHFDTLRETHFARRAKELHAA
jgi:hypothetical protein